MILGIDEVGRGVWAGPVVVGAVVLGEAKIAGLTDSKMLSKKKREALYEEIIAKADSVGLGWVSAEEIDDIGLSKALCLATRRAVRRVTSPFHEIIIDGTSNFLSGTPLEGYVSVMKKADLLISSVSAASIVAKVERDRYMASQDAIFPGYNFASHAGYGTAKHRQAIEEIGVSSLHRLSIAPLKKFRAKYIDEATATDVESITSREIGNQSEQTVADYLLSRGYKILDRNWRTRLCEIDIVAERSSELFFVEVKHRTKESSGDGTDAIVRRKLNQMKFASDIYVHMHGHYDKDRQLMVISTTGKDPVVSSVLEIE